MANGQAGVDLIGGDDADTLPGTRRDNTLDGGRGEDLLLGHAGDDRLIGGPEGPFYVRAENGGVLEDVQDRDELRGGEGNDTLLGGRYDLITFPDDNLLAGGRGDDRLDGSLGDDTLWGGEGDDTMFAGAGNDLQAGGPGADVVVLGFIAPTLPGTGLDRGDVIPNFEDGLDRLDLSRLRTGNNSDLPFEFLGEVPCASRKRRTA